MLRAEFTVEPFVPGDRGRHGEAALRALLAADLEVDDGPFGTAVVGADELVLPALTRALGRAMEQGATRISVQLTRVRESDDSGLDRDDR